MLHECGMSPLRILRAATVDAASFMRRNELGRLRTGAVADYGCGTRQSSRDNSTLPRNRPCYSCRHTICTGTTAKPNGKNGRLLYKTQQIPWKLQLETAVPYTSPRLIGETAYANPLCQLQRMITLCQQTHFSTHFRISLASSSVSHWVSINKPLAESRSRASLISSGLMEICRFFPADCTFRNSSR